MKKIAPFILDPTPPNESIPYRFNMLLQELEKRFEVPDDYQTSSRGSETLLLEAIDKCLASKSEEVSKKYMHTLYQRQILLQRIEDEVRWSPFGSDKLLCDLRDFILENTNG